MMKVNDIISPFDAVKYPEKALVLLIEPLFARTFPWAFEPLHKLWTVPLIPTIGIEE
jgi:hypothetical protein